MIKTNDKNKINNVDNKINKNKISNATRTEPINSDLLKQNIFMS